MQNVRLPVQECIAMEQQCCNNGKREQVKLSKFNSNKGQWLMGLDWQKQ